MSSIALVAGLCLLGSLLVSAGGNHPKSYSYELVPGQRPPQSGFEVEEGVNNLDSCEKMCGDFSNNKTSGPCAGFTLINVTADGVYLCAFFHSDDQLVVPSPPNPQLVGECICLISDLLGSTKKDAHANFRHL